MESKNIFIETYGCTSNKFDSEKMAGLLKGANFSLTSNEQDAEYIILNSCAVKAQTEEKVICRLKELSKLNKKLIVAGCLTTVNPERIRRTTPNFAAMIDTNSIHKIVDAITEIEKGDINIIRVSKEPVEKPLLPSVSFNKFISIIKLSEGCLSNCSFCATKLSRGNLYSYRPESIRNAVKLDLGEGKKEFYLSSEDTSAYGLDIGTNLPELLESIVKIEGNYFIRIGMMNPLHLLRGNNLKKLISIYKNEKIYKFLHLPIQSGSNEILNLMHRGNTVAQFKEIVNKFRKEIPEITLSTDIIVGFPTETEEQFNETLKLISEAKPDVLNLSRYGARKGTKAAEMKQVPDKIKNERSEKTAKLFGKIGLEQNKKWLGWQGSILISEKGKIKNSFIGRNFAYKPVVVKSAKNLLGKTVNVEIIKATQLALTGKIKF